MRGTKQSLKLDRTFPILSLRGTKQSLKLDRTFFYPNGGTIKL
ncbi:hypothetical protein ACN4EE_05945 [Geminocystis sp. CENA526]